MTEPQRTSAADARRAGIRRESVVITENVARVALAQVGAGGGLKAQRVEGGWVFAPYPGLTSVSDRSTLWFVGHDGTLTDLSEADADRAPHYGNPVATR